MKFNIVKKAGALILCGTLLLGSGCKKFLGKCIPRIVCIAAGRCCFRIGGEILAGDNESVLSRSVNSQLA